VQRRRAFRGTAIVGWGAVLLAVSLPFDWSEAGGSAFNNGIAALLLPLAFVAIALVAIASRRHVAWPFLYARVAGACALVAIAWAVFNEGDTVRVGVLFALLGAAMVVTGSSAALGPAGEVSFPPRRG
jgi:hypothetical protein